MTGVNAQYTSADMLPEALKNKCLSLQESMFWARNSQNSKHVLIHSKSRKKIKISLPHFSLLRLLNINLIHFNLTIPEVQMFPTTCEYLHLAIQEFKYLHAVGPVILPPIHWTSEYIICWRKIIHQVLASSENSSTSKYVWKLNRQNRYYLLAHKKAHSPLFHTMGRECPSLKTVNAGPVINITPLI